jgi:hypothetical protein
MIVTESSPNDEWTPDDEEVALEAITKCELIDVTKDDYTQSIELPVVTEDVEQRIKEIYELLQNPIYNIVAETGTVQSAGSGTETVTVEVKSAYEISEGTDVQQASCVDINKTVTLVCGVNNFPVEISNGTGSVDVLTPEKPGSVINLDIQNEKSNQDQLIVTDV